MWWIVLRRWRDEGHLTMKLYIDESGTVTHSKGIKNRFFIICFVQTTTPEKLIREFRKAKKTFIKTHPECNLDIKNEIKGSSMPFGMKKMIFERILKNTDVSFHYKIIDNWNLEKHLLNKPSIAFNYFIGITVEKIKVHINDIENDLFLLIDERNQSVESLNSLQDYLTIKYHIEKNYYDNITVKYKDSKSKDLIQLADIFANTLYRLSLACAKNIDDKKNKVLIDMCAGGFCDYFPYKFKENNFFI